MGIETGKPHPTHGRIDGGLVAFATILATRRVAVDPDHLRHPLGRFDAVSVDELLRLAKLQNGAGAKATKKSSPQTLVNPVDGTLWQLAIHTVGGVVEATKPVMVIVPDGWIACSRGEDPQPRYRLCCPGQAVAMKLKAFPFTRYGALPGRIERLGSDAVQDEKLRLVYPARIALDTPSKTAHSKEVETFVGMEVIADIRTGSRSILSYFLSPIDEAAQSAGHER